MNSIARPRSCSIASDIPPDRDPVIAVLDPIEAAPAAFAGRGRRSRKTDQEGKQSGKGIGWERREIGGRKVHAL